MPLSLQIGNSSVRLGQLQREMNVVYHRMCKFPEENHINTLEDVRDRLQDELIEINNVIDRLK